jgi:hypothetical protein
MSTPNKGHFEDAWKNAFDDAEMAPDMGVWEGIDDRLLAAQQAEKKKRRGFIWMSAAAIGLFILGSFTGWFFSTQQQSGTLASSFNVTESATDTGAQTLPEQATEQAFSSRTPEPTAAYPPHSTTTDAREVTNAAGASQAQHVNQMQSKAGAQKRNYTSNKMAASNGDVSNAAPASGQNTLAVGQANVIAMQQEQAGFKTGTGYAGTEYEPSLELTDASRNQALKVAFGKTTTDAPALLVQQQNSRAGSQHTSRQSAPIAFAAQPTPAQAPAPAEAAPAPIEIAAESTAGKRNSLKKLFILNKEPKEKETWIAESKEDKPKKDKNKSTANWISLGITPAYASAGIGAAQSGSRLGSGTFSNTSVVQSNSIYPDLVQDQRTEASYIISVSAGQQISDRWQLVSGLQYINNQSSFTTSSFQVYSHTAQMQPVIASMLSSAGSSSGSQNDAHLDMGGRFGSSSYFNSGSEERLYNQVQYMGIPVKVNFLFARKKKINMHVSSGVAADVFIKSDLASNSSHVASNTYQSPENSSYRSVTMSGLLGLGTTYQYSDKYSFSVEPTFRQAIFSSIRSASGLRSLPANAGIEVSLRRNL